METKRADVLLCAAGLAESRTRAQLLIKRGAVTADGLTVKKPSELLAETAVLAVEDDAAMPVSRAGEKLGAALVAFGTEVAGKVFADIGASTGGFTQRLLLNGAKKVYAVDVGHDQLHHSLREDERVVVMEGVNARTLTTDMFADALDGAVMDVSFISQSLIYPALSRLLPSGAPLITLVKPQFEVGRENIGKNGIVTDKSGALRRLVMQKLTVAAAQSGFEFVNETVSPIKGGDGNTEYLALFIKR